MWYCHSEYFNEHHTTHVVYYWRWMLNLPRLMLAEKKWFLHIIDDVVLGHSPGPFCQDQNLSYPSVQSTSLARLMMLSVVSVFAQPPAGCHSTLTLFMSPRWQYTIPGQFSSSILMALAVISTSSTRDSMYCVDLAFSCSADGLWSRQITQSCAGVRQVMLNHLVQYAVESIDYGSFATQWQSRAM